MAEFMLDADDYFTNTAPTDNTAIYCEQNYMKILF